MPRKEFSLEEQYEAKKALEEQLEKNDYYIWEIITHNYRASERLLLISLSRRPNWIRCKKCGHKSYDIGDIKSKRCGRCNEFHKTTEDYETGYEEKLTGR